MISWPSSPRCGNSLCWRLLSSSSCPTPASRLLRLLNWQVCYCIAVLQTVRSITVFFKLSGMSLHCCCSNWQFRHCVPVLQTDSLLLDCCCSNWQECHYIVVLQTDGSFPSLLVFKLTSMSLHWCPSNGEVFHFIVVPQHSKKNRLSWESVFFFMWINHLSWQFMTSKWVRNSLMSEENCLTRKFVNLKFCVCVKTA